MTTLKPWLYQLVVVHTKGDFKAEHFQQSPELHCCSVCIYLVWEQDIDEPLARLGSIYCGVRILIIVIDYCKRQGPSLPRDVTRLCTARARCILRASYGTR